MPAPPSCVIRTLNDATIRFFAWVDATKAVEIDLTLVHTNGDTSYSGGNALGGGNRALSVFSVRGGSNSTNGETHTRAGAHEPPTLTLSVMHSDTTETTVGTPRDWVYRVAGTPFAAIVGEECADGEVFSFGVEITFDGVALEDGGTDQTLTYTECICTAYDFAEGEPNAFTMTMQVMGTETAAIVVP